MDFTDKVVLVTGASRGIGREIAQQFAAKGARVAIHFHQNSHAAQETYDQLEGMGHLIVQADIADPGAVQHMVDHVVGVMGGLDIVVNNAGIYKRHVITEMTYEAWQDIWTDTLQTNLIGAANVIHCAARHMIKRGGGRIVNVSSRGAFRGEPSAPAYGASKAGMNALGQSMAVALAPHGIYVTTVAPGWVETDMAQDSLDGPQGESILNQSPLGRVATPAEVARAVLFLAAEGSEFTTGAILDVNGASYLRT